MSETETIEITNKELEDTKEGLPAEVKEKLKNINLEEYIRKKFKLNADDKITPKILNEYSNNFYDSGNEEEQKLAVVCYKLAAGKGNASAMYNYALMLDDGDGIDVNKAEAAKYYKMTAENFTEENDKKDALKNLTDVLYKE